jgi:hypothetical protein
MTVALFLKKLVLQTLNWLARPFIACLDLRKNLKDVNIVQEGLLYTPDFGKTKTDRQEYYWRSFNALRLDPLFYKKIDQALIVGDGVIVNGAGKVILESTLFQREYLFKLKQNHLLLSRFFLKKKRQQKPMLSLSNVLEDNYYHWIMESVTRVLLIENFIDLRMLMVIINDHERKFKTESLLFLFGLPSSNIALKATKEVFEGSVVIPSFTHTRNEVTKMTDVYYPSLIRDLNLKVFQKLNSSSSRNFPLKFILSRKKAANRRIVNEEFLLAAICDKSFTIIAAEDLSFEDQVNLFFHARVVISTHGSGLTNIVFSRDITVIELFPEDRNPRDAFIFTQLSSALGFKHHLISYSPHNKTEDVMADAHLVDSINAILKGML